jgi:hypothetical protein
MSTAILLEKPAAETRDPIYSNFDHKIDTDVAQLLGSAAPGVLCAHHAARGYWGWVWRLADFWWVDQVWQNGGPVFTATADSLLAVIRLVVDQYGSA